MAEAARSIEPESSSLPSAELDVVEAALERAREHLLGQQHEDGHWCGELVGSTILESEFIFLLWWLGRFDDVRIEAAARTIRARQESHGGWGIFPGGPTDVSASVEAYFVLKAVGDEMDAPHMLKARQAILGAGGIEACNTYTKLYLAIFGQIAWSDCPAIPPEVMFLPKKGRITLYEMSSWSRPILVPMAVIWAHKPVKRLPVSANIPELFSGVAPPYFAKGNVEKGWRSFFHAVDYGLKVLDRAPIKPLRASALRRAEKWMVERMELSDGPAAIFPPIINSVMALTLRGYAATHPIIEQLLAELEKLEIWDGDTLRLQPCKGPVWDTARALRAIQCSGLPSNDPRILKAASWLVDREVKRTGDWKHKSASAHPGGWYFQYRNEFNPDCDDTAHVLTDLAHVDPSTPEGKRTRLPRQRGLEWMLNMQNDDGGWGAFDKGCNQEILNFVPFADHNAMLDPSWEDITGGALEMLASEGYTQADEVVRKAIGFLLTKQEDDGTWFGRWGCNYIYGTWLALQGLKRVGVDMTEERFQRAGEWLRAHQNVDGGWGETPESYDRPELKGTGPSTPTQTAWALMGLFATGDYDSAEVERGIEYLLTTQNSEGSWSSEHWTGTGFPGVFYLDYDFYDKYFPLMALGLFNRPIGVPDKEDVALITDRLRPNGRTSRKPRHAKMPAHITTSMLKQQVTNRLLGKKRFPFVLMLEPLYTCNLACLGCSVERHTGKLKDRLPVEDCLKAVDDSQAPIVSICGGEPTIYPELKQLVDGIIERKRHIYLCTNALLLDKNLFDVVPPNKRLTVNVHLDGMRETHDHVCARKGVFDKAIEMIREAKARGYHVTTNTTIFKETSVDEVEELCAFVTDLGVDGMLISPGYSYESVERDMFLTRSDIQNKIRRILEFADRYPLTSTPLFLEFAAGYRDYNCSPWSTVTYTPLGWKGPCYLIGKKYTKDWNEFWSTTDWDYWESREDKLCQNCAMHSGFEASVVMNLHKSPKDIVRLTRWQAGV